jgi:triphosphatase
MFYPAWFKNCAPNKENYMPQECQPGQESVRNALKSQLAIVCDQVEGVRAYETVAIHDMRRASRRLRMALRIFRPYLKKSERKALSREARTITRALGRRRELDVMVAMLREHREETHGLWKRFMDHAIAILEERCERAQQSCMEAVAVAEGNKFQHAQETLLASVDTTGCCVISLAQTELLDALEFVRATRKWWKKSGEAEDLHVVRIAIKHFRYACEFHQSIYGTPMEAYIAQLKEAQSGLGEWNECRLLEDMVLTLGNAADYNLAQGAPLVAEAYGERAAVLEAQFAVGGKALFCKKSRKAFEALLESGATDCCRSEG